MPRGGHPKDLGKPVDAQYRAVCARFFYMTIRIFSSCSLDGDSYRTRTAATTRPANQTEMAQIESWHSIRRGGEDENQKVMREN